MRFFSVLGVLFYSAVITLIGIVLIIFSLNFILPQDINHLLVLAKDSNQTRIILGLSGCLLILISYSFAQLILGKIQRERTIAFTTAGGQVTISLSAVEDLIRRLAVVIPEIRDIKPDVVATKKGIIVDMRVVLRSEANIPELTSRLQETTRAKIQEVLGLEEQIIIRIHVAKIVHDEKDKKRKDFDKEQPPAMPFGGYGRI